MTQQEILNFINTYCIKCSDDEDIAITELMMDNHKCIKFNNQEYYVLEENSLWNSNDEEIYEYLIENYKI